MKSFLQQRAEAAAWVGTPAARQLVELFTTRGTFRSRETVESGRDGDRTRRHVAIVYQWRARANDDVVALSATEFFERRRMSLSGSFVAPAQLATDVDNGQVCESWKRRNRPAPLARR